MKKIFLLILIIILFFSYSFLESKLVEYKKIEIKNNQIPKSFDNFKIIFISDFHKRIYLEPNKIKKIVEKINKENPDMVLLGGDYINQNKKDVVVFSELKNINSKHGVYGVYGNHDIWIGEDLLKQYFKENNINDLNNNSYWVEKNGEKIKIGGVGDLWKSDQDLLKTTNDLDQKDYSILISHNPDYIEEIKSEDKIDLILSGHTHGGQITFFGLFAPLNPSKYKYLKGLYKFENKEMYITRGVGESFHLPFRFFARPEITEIILKSN